MSRFTDTLEHNLEVIADRATPSPDAWESIRTRIDEQEPIQETEIIMLTENTLTRRRWPLVAAAAAVAALAIGAIALVNRDDGAEQPADVPEPTPTIDPAPEPETETADVEFGPAATPTELPAAGAGSRSWVEPGRYTTGMLGVDINFDIPNPMYVDRSREGHVLLVGLLEGELGALDDYTPDNGIYVSMRRIAGWSTADEALQVSNVGSIEPYDLGAWIDSNDVIVSLDARTEVDGRATRLIQVRRAPDAETTGSCLPGWEPCAFVAAVASDSYGARSDGTMSAVDERWYLVTIEGSEPLLIVAGGGDGSIWFDEFENELLADIELGPDAPPLNYTAPARIIGDRATVSADSETTGTDAGTSTVQDATALLDDWVESWNAGDQAAVADLFVPDAVLTTPDGRERVGPAAGDYMASFVPMFTRLSRSSDGVDAGDGSFSFDVEWKSEFQIDERVLVITQAEGQLLVMDEQLP